MTEIANRTEPPVRRIRWKRYVIGGLGLLLLILIALGPDGRSQVSPSHRESSRVLRQAHTIGLLMAAYADAHGGEYPTGNSSTEIFQKLVDENHMTSSGKSPAQLRQEMIDNPPENDPAIFWVDLPGKTPATSTVLKPENVCWDVTAPVDANSPGELPLVFVTGYRVTYVPGGTAVPLPGTRERLWWTDVTYKDGSARAVYRSDEYQDWPYFSHDGTILNFIPTTFDPASKKYQQLTPDGPLAP